MSFNDFIKRIKAKHVLFGAMCVLLVLMVVLFCIVAGKVSSMFQTPPDDTLSTEGTGDSQSTTQPTQTEQTAPTQSTTAPTDAATLPTEPGHEHEFVLTESVPATCENYGYNIYTCSCGKQDIPLDEQVEPCGHSFGAGQTVSATCTTDGYVEYVCSRCGAAERRNQTAALGHDFRQVETAAPTCVDDGYTLHRCSHCGQEEKKDVVQAQGHDYQMVGHTDVSCTEDECTVYQCSTCQEIDRVYGAASNGHLWSDWDQATLTRQCGSCGLTEAAASIAITNEQASSDYVQDAAGNSYKLYVIYVGTSTTPDLFRYTVNDYLDNGTLAYRYDPAQGLIVTYTTNGGENRTVVLPMLQSASTTVAADAASLEATEATE